MFRKNKKHNQQMPKQVNRPVPVRQEPVKVQADSSTNYYDAYVKGESIQSIADKAKVEPQEVLDAIAKIEARRAK